MQKIDLPITRYYGSKRKLVKKIWDVFDELDLKFDSVLDVFGGSAIFSYYAKKMNKSVIYNDIFRFNYLIGKALIENKRTTITQEQIVNLLSPKTNGIYRQIVNCNYKDIYFTDVENKLIDIVIQNIEKLENEFDKASAYYVLFQTCLIKRPFNIFHRKNLSLRINHVNSNFGNKKTWEKTFEELFIKFHMELKHFQFDNLKNNICVNSSALNCNSTADLVYIDPPYFNEKGTHVSYHSRYHFLEGLSNYDKLESNISLQKNNKEIIINKINEFEDRKTFLDDLTRLINKHINSIIAISYRNNGFPSIDEIADLLKSQMYGCKVDIIDLGDYSYALNRNNLGKKEYLIIGRKQSD